MSNPVALLFKTLMKPLHSQWSWCFKQSDWFTISDYSTIFTLLRVDNAWARCFSHFFRYPRVDIFKDKRKLWRIQNGVISFTVADFYFDVECLQLLFIRVEEAILWTQFFLTWKFLPRNQSFFLCQTKMKSNVWGNSTFQVNRTKNTTEKRLLISNNRAAMSASCGERHKKCLTSLAS